MKILPRYENIFGEDLLNIDGLDDHIKKTFAKKEKQPLVRLLNRKKEIPKWDELKVCQKTMEHGSVSLYAI